MAITDAGDKLNGLWHSTGPNLGVDKNSQNDPYTVTVAGGQTNPTGDFGYYSAPAQVGNFVWNDLNKDGIQDASELGIAGAKVTLTIAYPNGDTVTAVTTTDANGLYSFGNLLLDESFNASASGDPATTGLPKYIISVAPPSGFTPTLLNQGNGMNDSDDPAGTVAVVTQGQVDNNFDFGFYSAPTSVTVGTLQATPQSPWETLLTLLRQLAQPAIR